MSDLVERIAKADENELQTALNAIRKRYAERFPDWEVNIVSLEKKEDRNQQIDQMIYMLQKLKEHK